MRYYFNESRFVAISTLGNEYDTREPLVDLVLNVAESYDERNALSIMGMFSESNPTVFRYGYPKAQYGLRFNGNVLRQVIDTLFQKNQINGSDRSKIEENIKSFEKSIERRTLVTEELNTAQEEAMDMILSPYIDGIIDQVSSLSLAIKLYGIGMCDTPLGNDGPQETKNLIVNNYMRTRGIKDEFEALVTDKEKRQEIYDCIGC